MMILNKKKRLTSMVYMKLFQPCKCYNTWKHLKMMDNQEFVFIFGPNVYVLINFICIHLNYVTLFVSSDTLMSIVNP